MTSHTATLAALRGRFLATSTMSMPLLIAARYAYSLAAIRKPA